MKYDHTKIEKKWRLAWAKQKKLYAADEKSKKPKYYVLDMFPYPSGEGFHVGHPLGYTASDIYSRFLRMHGYNVLHPMGWDAFGLPAENYAIKHKVHPAQVVKQNITNFRKQMDAIGFSYDWSREINTTDPEYYKWTQWIFLKLFEKELAYEAELPINFCPSCKTGLANEEVVDGKCERCGTPVIQKKMRQWVLKITAYADRLLADLEGLDWPEKIIAMQRNWIGRSEGAEIVFKLKVPGQPDTHRVKAFTTRPYTLFGATFVAIAPELAQKWLNVGWQASEEVKKFISDELARKVKADYTPDTEKRGVFSGVTAVNPANGKEIPVWVVNYVLADVGTGAIMAVPAHDQRDFEFAQKFNLPIEMVICPNYPEPVCPVLEKAHEGGGHLVGSGKFDGMESEKAKKAITEFVGGTTTVKYKLRDWIFSRQRYWGEPIPVIRCKNCGNVPLAEKDLPLKLPNVKNYEPTGTGESPLAAIEKWVNVKCPKCKGPAKRETNTMPQWAGSCWYYLRYLDPKNKKKLVDPKKEKYWMAPAGVDVYVGGAEHAVLHLLYARFWHKVLYDIGVVSTKEPFRKLMNQGLMMGENGEKMSKSKGNVVTVKEVLETHGADVLRMYEMFMGPFEDAKAWDTKSIIGIRRFVERIHALREKVSKKEKAPNALLHKTVKKVTEDIKEFKFNTAISAMMILLNDFEKRPTISAASFEMFVKILAPFAPYCAEELWSALGKKKSVHLEAWPQYDPALVKEEEFDLVIQVNGKTRGTVKARKGISEEEAKALAQEKVSQTHAGAEVKKVFFVQDRLINCIV